MHSPAGLVRCDGVYGVQYAATRIKTPITKYYYANGQRVATRVDGTLYYVHSDHPSTSLRTGPSISSGRGLGSTVALSDVDR